MSSPISNFSKLSLTQRMQSSRGQSYGQSSRKGKGRASSFDNDPSTSDESSGERSGSDEESGSDDDIEEGTDIVSNGHVFALDHCRQYGTRYAFQIACAEVERFSIRISTTDAGRPSCTCKEGGACGHINWLLGQLSHTRPQPFEDITVSPYDQISAIGISKVCEKLQWELREGTNSDTEETQWELRKAYNASGFRQTRGMIRHRLEVVRDIMAALSPYVRDDYRKDLFEGSDDISLESIYVQSDLEATVSKLLIIDDDLFNQFQKIVPRDLRAQEDFRKMGTKAIAACDSLDTYCQVGPASGDHDVIWCAQSLVDIVESISASVAARQPLSPASREEAAKSLVTILRMVVRDRNHDVYQNLTWPRHRKHAEPQIDRNLYQRLIGSMSRSNPAGGNFVIKALLDLPEAKSFADELEDILGTLKTIGWGPAPSAYTDKLSALITQLKGSTDQVAASSSGGKRPAGTFDRKVKRMK